MLSPAQFVTICFAGLFCLAPVSFYLCWLAGVNRRERPTVVAGAWDFAAVLGSLAGFLVVGGVLLLSLVSSNGQLFTGGHVDRLKIVFEAQWLTWLTLFIVYTAVIAFAATIGVRGRQRWLAVYNLDADTAGRVIEAALERSGLAAKREGDWWVRAEPSSEGRRLVIAKTFHGTAHTTIRLVCTNDRLREEIERHLRSELDAVEGGPGPAAPWFSSIAVGSVILVCGFVGLIAYFVFLGR